MDITSGKFVFSASEAYWVENGRILYPVRGRRWWAAAPNAPGVRMIGNDMRLDSGSAPAARMGKSAGRRGQPTLRIDGLTVGGTA